MQKAKIFFSGILIGLINALFGAGGGMIAVPVLKSLGLEQKQAQATAISIILPLSLISTAVYLYRGYFEISQAFWYIPFGLVGAIVGTKLMKKAPNKMLKNIFCVFMIWAGVRMIFK